MLKLIINNKVVCSSNTRNYLLLVGEVMRRKSKVLYICLIIAICFTIGIGYSIINRTLIVTGNSEVKQNTWDLHFDNIQVRNGSVTANLQPTITNDLIVDFNVLLEKPGDFYEFTVDVVNSGTIDAMIDSLTKTPELTEEQTKYLNYIVEYQNGEQISSKQLLKINSSVRLKVKVEYKKDITADDLPNTLVTLDLSFKVNYIQANKIETTMVSNNGKIIRVINGDYDTVGSEVCIGEECFFVISSSENDVTLLSKYNLYVGNNILEHTPENGVTLLEPIANPTGIQKENARGWVSVLPWIGTMPFSSTTYWTDTISNYPAYVFNELSNTYIHVYKYKDYLEKTGIFIKEARLITYEELVELGCTPHGSCTESPSWVYLTSYWTGSAGNTTVVWGIDSDGVFTINFHGSHARGVRPVLIIDKSQF